MVASVCAAAKKETLDIFGTDAYARAVVRVVMSGIFLRPGWKLIGRNTSQWMRCGQKISVFWRISAIKGAYANVVKKRR